MTSRSLNRVLSISFLALMMSGVGCGNSNSQDKDETILSTPEVADKSIDDPDDRRIVQPADACENKRNCDNCVFYAGCRAPGLPGGLYTFNDKKNIINSDNASVGCVAIIDTGTTAGHVAYVAAVDHDPHQVTLDESNWNGGGCGHRTDSKSALHIVGYWCP